MGYQESGLSETAGFQFRRIGESTAKLSSSQTMEAGALLTSALPESAVHHTGAHGFRACTASKL
jgi:hypothetical protein